MIINKIKQKKANNLIRNRNFSEAIELYELLIADNPDVPTFYEGLLLACFMSKNFTKMKRVVELIISKGLEDKVSFFKFSWYLKDFESIKQSFKTQYYLVDTKISNQAPLVSVVIPVFNSEKYLGYCLDSLSSQDFLNYELIIVDDGSTDNSLNIIKEKIKNFSNVKIFTTLNGSGNPGSPRNFGISNANGKYLLFIDSDDWVEKDFLNRMVSTAQLSNAEIVFSKGFYSHEKEGVEVRKYDINYVTDPDSVAYKYHQSFMIWDKIYSTEFLKLNEILLGETKAAVDVPFILKAYYLTSAVTTLDYIGYHYRRETESSVTLNYRKGSNCEFELQAFTNVYNWMNGLKSLDNYIYIIQYRNISSFIYSLRMISPDYFSDFFRKVKKQFKKFDYAKIKEISVILKDAALLNKFNELLQMSATDWVFKYRKNDLEIISSISKDFDMDLLSSHLSGDNSILFVPDWSARNPYQKLLYRSIRESYNVGASGIDAKYFNKNSLESLSVDHEFLHIHWEHVLYDSSDLDSIGIFEENLKLAKNLGYKILWTIHNRLPHDAIEVDIHIQARRMLVKYCDKIFIHGEKDIELIKNELNVEEEKLQVIKHGSYRNYYPNFVSKVNARKHLKLKDSDFVLLFFGNIKGYKGVAELIDAFKQLRKSHKNLKLLIAGRVFDDEVNNFLNKEKLLDKNLNLFRKYIPDNEVQYYFNSADLVVLPYKSILTSGVASLAVSFGCKVFLPRLGLLEEYVPIELGYFFNANLELYSQLEVVISEMMNNDTHSKTEVNGVAQSYLNDFNWHNIVRNQNISNIFGGRFENQSLVDCNFNYLACFVRVLGNDLSGLHNSSQTEDNLKYILENESNFKWCKKLWVLNRIIDNEKLNNIKKILDFHKQEYHEIPFSNDEFSNKGYIYDKLPQSDCLTNSKFIDKSDATKSQYLCAVYEDKNKYLINNNGARNVALRIGLACAKWAFPLDGNCFFTDESLNSIKKFIDESVLERYLILPMHRLGRNTDLSDNFLVNPVEEPQIGFHFAALESFDEDYFYGFKPKVDLLRRLGVPGVWDEWATRYPWYKESINIAKEANMYSYVGYVVRLASGNIQTTSDDINRAVSREASIIKFISSTDKRILFQDYSSEQLLLYRDSNIKNINNKYKTAIIDDAILYLESPLYSVVNKKTLPPSEDAHDYWHPAPYAWPNPDSEDGLPYIHRDGVRVPGTKMYDSDSEKYDRTSIQRLFNEVTTLAVAWKISGNIEFAIKGAKQIHNWFVNNETKMNPNLNFSQVVMGKNNNNGTKSGIIETKDFYFLLDGVRLLKESGFFTEEDDKLFVLWIKDFLKWLLKSEQGFAESQSDNNHGIAYDLQVYALASYIGDIDLMYQTFIRSLGRLGCHFLSDGLQPHEMKRTTTQHYTSFNLQLWINYSCLVKNSIGYDLWSYKKSYIKENLSNQASPLKLGIKWLANTYGKEWPFQQIDDFDINRQIVIFNFAKKHCPFLKDFFLKLPPSETIPSSLHPHDGAPIFWTLAID